jgi:hypothetical protein
MTKSITLRGLTLAAAFSIGAVGLTTVSGCTNSGVKSQNTATSSLQEVEDGLQGGMKQVDQIALYLTDMQQGRDLESNYSNFRKELARLEKTADSVRSRRAAMATRTEAHAEKWKADMASLSSEAAKEQTAQRMDTYKQSVATVAQTMDQVKDSYEAYVSDLKDIDLILGNDLSVQGVSMISETINQAIEKGKQLKSQTQRAMNSIASARSEFAR